MTLTDLLKELAQAAENYGNCQTLVKNVQRDELDARNRLNELQKRVGEEMEALRANAPDGTDWFFEHGRRMPVAAKAPTSSKLPGNE